MKIFQFYEALSQWEHGLDNPDQWECSTLLYTGSKLDLFQIYFFLLYVFLWIFIWDIALKTLELSDIAQVSEDILTRAAVKLHTLLVHNPTTTLLEEILTRLATTQDSKLRRLELPFNGQRKDLTHLHPKIVGDAVVKLENADDLLRLIRLTAEQIVDLMIKIRDTKDLRITMLPLYSHNISQVPPGVLAKVITRMEKVCSIPPVVTPLQLAAIFTSLANQQGQSARY